MWGWETRPPCGARCTDTQIGREFLNIGYSLQGGLPYQPWAAELVKKRRADLAKDDPNIHCMPRGAPRIWTDDYYKRIFQIPGRLVILTERNMQYRQIFTDGRPVPVDANPTWNGYSSGRWEGDTLVVHTNGFRDDLWLDSDGNPLTGAANVTEKLRRPNYGTLGIEITVDDPKAYTAPWTVKLTQPIRARQRALGLLLPGEREGRRAHGGQVSPRDLPGSMTTAHSDRLKARFRPCSVSRKFVARARPSGAPVTAPGRSTHLDAVHAEQGP